MASWVPVPVDSDFSLQNLPYGVFRTTADSIPHIGVAIGNNVLDLKILAQEQIFADIQFDTRVLRETTLNSYAALGQTVHGQVRRRLQDLLAEDSQLHHVLRYNKELRQKCLLPMEDAIMHLPVTVGDFTDFFIGLHHANNCADFLKAGADITQILPNFWDAPNGFHGRSSSVVVSGTPMHRPRGQTRVDGKSVSEACQSLDFEVEFGMIIGQPSKMGTAGGVDQAKDHIFGFVLLNDWSARDFQKNEPTAPFTCKNFATSISPWIVPFEALQPYRVAPIEANRPLPDYLVQKDTQSIFEVPIRATLEDGSSEQRLRRSYLEDGDIVEFSAQIRTPDGLGNVGFGLCRGQVLPVSGL